jgi:Kdo2-lipid IVA lauroyltransferase/acyltransferase
MEIRNAFLKFIISVFASLPFGILYLLADLLAFLGQYVIKYRREVVYQNLRNSFPEKSEKEINKIAKHFYKNLADLVFETFKSFKMKKEVLQKRVKFKNQEVIDQLYVDKKNVFATLGHCGNWEWVGNRIALFLQHEGAAIYKPIHDKFFDNYMIGIRQKYKDTLMIDYKRVFRTLVSLKQKLFTVFILSDQSPPRTELNYFVDFLSQKTAFYDGMEKVARTLNYAVIYLDIKRVSRGFYEVEIIPITHDAKNTKEDFITKEYIRLLEKSIISQPDNWLWSHRRWKNREEN